MSKLGTGLLWLSVLLFVVAGTLLSTSAGIPKFGVSTEDPFSGDGPEQGLGATSNGLTVSTVQIGAFRINYDDGGDDGTLYISSMIDAQCHWKSDSQFTEGIFRGDPADCQRFNAFRSLLIIAVCFNFITAVSIYSCLLVGRWPSQALPGSHTSLAGPIALSVFALLGVAANAACIGLMVGFVFEGFVGGTQYGVSFWLMVAAFPISIVAAVIFAADCVYYWYRSHNTFAAPSKEGRQDGVVMAAIPPDVTLTIKSSIARDDDGRH